MVTQKCSLPYSQNWLSQQTLRLGAARADATWPRLNWRVGPGSDAGKNEGARLGCFTASAIFFRSCSFRLLPFQILGTSFSRRKFRIRGGLKNWSFTVFWPKRPKNFKKWNFEFDWKMERCCGNKWKIRSWLKKTPPSVYYLRLTYGTKSDRTQLPIWYYRWNMKVKFPGVNVLELNLLLVYR